MEIKKIVISSANFLLTREKFTLLHNFSNNKFSGKKIRINNSKIFFKDNLGETITIIKVFKSFLFLDDERLFNLFSLNGEIFNIPFTFDFENPIDKKIKCLKKKK